jgi:hypothetical protein
VIPPTGYLLKTMEEKKCSIEIANQGREYGQDLQDEQD